MTRIKWNKLRKHPDHQALFAFLDLGSWETISRPLKSRIARYNARETIARLTAVKAQILLVTGTQGQAAALDLASIYDYHQRLRQARSAALARRELRQTQQRLSRGRYSSWRALSVSWVKPDPVF